MKKINSIILLAVCLISLVSCGKMETEVNTVLDGDYAFLGLQADVTNEATVTYQGISNKTITNTKYTSEENKGTIAISGTQMTTSNLSYSAQLLMHIKAYTDGVLTDDYSEDTGVVEVPSSNGFSKFKLVGTDSIYFESAGFLMEDDVRISQPQGGKYKLDGDKLVFTFNVNHQQTITQQGAVSVSKSTGKTIVTFKRK